jgi:hypothetical protein
MAMERRLEQAPLPLPVIAVGCQQAFASHAFDEGSTARPFVEICAAPLQDVLHVVRVIEQVDDLRPEPEAHDVAVVSGRRHHQPQHVAPERLEVAEEWVSRWPGRGRE